MGNRRGRELRLKQEQEASWEKLRTEPRRATDRVGVFGSGQCRIQISCSPSFLPAQFWEIRQLEEEWTLYSSTVIRPWPDLTLIGYESVKFQTEGLRDYFNLLVALALPIAPDLGGMEGLDGAITQIA